MRKNNTFHRSAAPFSHGCNHMKSNSPSGTFTIMLDRLLSKDQTPKTMTIYAIQRHEIQRSGVFGPALFKPEHLREWHPRPQHFVVFRTVGKFTEIWFLWRTSGAIFQPPARHGSNSDRDAGSLLMQRQSEPEPQPTLTVT